jgi:hypothetical protein
MKAPMIQRRGKMNPRMNRTRWPLRIVMTPAVMNAIR